MRTIVLIIALSLCLPTAAQKRRDSKPKSPEYNVAAYIWPSCHDDPVGRRVLWGEGHGEWEIIKRGTPRFDGHYQPRQPLWGYEHDDDPKVMERWIDAAADHGVNVFVFDWYWYDGGPFLEGCLNDGFLKARNRDRMRFCVMWANHTVKRNYWNCHRYGDDESVLWTGAVDEENFRKVVDRVIGQYFSQPNYFKIDGRPVFSVFSIDELLNTFGGDAERARKGIEYFREKTREAGFPDLCLQVMVFGHDAATAAKVRAIGADCTTQYGWATARREDYLQWAKEGTEATEAMASAFGVPHYPSVSIGWDDTPRFPAKGKADVVHHNVTPQAFATALQRAKEYCDARPEQMKLITIYAFNEWVEGAYLLPDMRYGFGYLEAVRDVLDGRYDRYKSAPGQTDGRRGGNMRREKE